MTITQLSIGKYGCYQCGMTQPDCDQDRDRQIEEVKTKPQAPLKLVRSKFGLVYVLPDDLRPEHHG
jgi:hypothetical protein